MRLLLLEKAPAVLQTGPEDQIVALTPEACLALEERGLPYRIPPDLGTEERIRQSQDPYFREQLGWFRRLDAALLERVPELESSAISPTLLYGYRLKTLLDDLYIRGAECSFLLEEGYRSVQFYGTPGVYARVLSSLCREKGVAYAEHLSVPNPAPVSRYGALRSVWIFVRETYLRFRCRSAAALSPGLSRLTLLFLETDHDLRPLLHSAFKKGHRCILWKESRQPREGKPLDSVAEELFSLSSPVWSWFRQKWPFPAEELLADPLKEWVRTELAQMLPQAEEFRRLYRNEKVDFILTTKLVSTTHAAAMAACDPNTGPQSVLIAHGDGPETKPAWDLFELAPYQHYFVPNREFARYFEGRRLRHGFPTAQVHIGSYRWRNYTQLRRKSRLTLDRHEGSLSLKWNQPPVPIPLDKPVVVYPVCQPETDVRYLNPLGYSETGYFRLQRRLLKVLEQFPDYTFVIKLFPPQTAKTSTLAKALSRTGAKNIFVSSAPFSRWLPWADRVLLDCPSTPLYETALAGVPFHLLVSPDTHPPRPAALDPFKGQFTRYHSLEEAEDAIRQFLRGPNSNTARVQPESGEILEELAAVKKDRILITSPQGLQKRSLRALRGTPWIYLGVQASDRSRLEAVLGSERLLPVAADLQETADRIRKPFLDFVAQVGSHQESLISWWSSRFSWKMWTASDLFLLTVYLKLAQRRIADALRAHRPLLLIVEDPWLLRQLRENLKNAEGSVLFFGVKSPEWQKLKAALSGTARRLFWLLKTLRDYWKQKRAWPHDRQQAPAEPSAAIFSVPVAGAFQPGGGWQDPHLPEIHGWLNDAGYRVFRFSPPDYPGYERELAERAAYFYPLILGATAAGIWRSLLAHWRPQWPEQLEVDGLNVERLSEREAWLETGRASLSSYRLFYECLRKRLERGNWRWLIFFYENQPWEKLAVLCARERGIKTAGIQTAILSPEYLPYLLGESEKQVAPMPDAICTSGPYAQRLLSDWGNSPHRLKPCGALRYPGLADAAFREEEAQPEDVSRSEILVVLPIYPPMAGQLLNALENAFPDGGASRGLRFNVRPHPLCPIRSSQVKFPARVLGSEFGNVREAIRRCGLILFVGSTVGFEALHLGRPVLRYRPDALPDMDSVYGPAVPVCSDKDLAQKLLWLVREGYAADQWEGAQKAVSGLFAASEPGKFLEIFTAEAPLETMVR